MVYLPSQCKLKMMDFLHNEVAPVFVIGLPVVNRHTSVLGIVLTIIFIAIIRITLDGKTLEDVKTFTYLGSIIDEHGESDADVKSQIGKVRAAYLQLKKICSSKQLSTNTKVRIFNTNVKTVLLYGAETWKTTKAIIRKIQMFINSCLPKILRIRLQDTISNNLRGILKAKGKEEE
ncbi:unnamed protein product [Schistosoma margrebowiei]|uniref:Uncharacterized protein n=1 Tax=Schistosoma margrebowiei TaxID=48269 RepID=A0A183LMW9_9TREM|nr:unnamed protein product [Schistosoma margrebowiei]